MTDFLDFPLHTDGRGRTAVTEVDDHVRDMIYQVLFTSPGERVNRPDFGCGLLQLVFTPNSDIQATTVKFLVLGSLQRWLGDVIAVEEVEIVNEDERLEVMVVYRRRGNGSLFEARFAAPTTRG